MMLAAGNHNRDSMGVTRSAGQGDREKRCSAAELAAAASLRTFQSETYETYVDNLTTCVKNLVMDPCRFRTSRRSPTSTKYTSNAMMKGGKHWYADNAASDTVGRKRKRGCEHELNEALLSVDWMQLCDFHDKHSRRGSPAHNPLRALIDTLLNPAVIPYVFRPHLVQTFIQVLTSSPRMRRQRGDVVPALDSMTSSSSMFPPSGSSGLQTQFTRWTPSQHLLLHSIKKIVNATPSLRLNGIASAFIRDARLLSTQAQDERKTRRWPSQMHRLISVLHFLHEECTPAIALQIIESLMEVATTVDDWQIHQRLPINTSASAFDLASLPSTSKVWVRLQKTDSGRKTKADIKAKARTGASMSHSPHRPQKRTKITLSDIHDGEAMSLHEQRLKRQFWGAQRQSPSISLKAIINEPVPGNRATSGSTHKSIITATQNAQTSLWEQIGAVRSRAYRKLQDCFVRNHSILRHSSHPARIQNDSIWPHQIVQMVAARATSPSMRLCMALSVQRRPFQCEQIASVCWNCYQRCGRWEYLRIFSEWIVECSAFDCRQRCYNALRPLLESIKASSPEASAMEQRGRVEAEAETETKVAAETRNLPCSSPCRFAVAHILSRRLSQLLLEQDAITASIWRYANHFAVVYSSPSLWIPSNPPESESRQKILRALQRLSIIGLLDISEDHTAADDDDDDDDDAVGGGSVGDVEKPPTKVGGAWPFADSLGMRDAARREELDIFDGLLSCNRKSAPEADGRVAIESEQTLPVPNDLWKGMPAEMLQHILVYCEPAALYCAFQVCKVWNDCSTKSNWFWHHVYKHRFGCMDKALSSGKPTPALSIEQWDWKHLFLEKEATNQSVRFNRHKKTGWKYRTCNYLGCLTIMKSEQQQQNHYAMHQRREVKEEQKRHKQKQQKQKMTAKSRATSRAKRPRAKATAAAATTVKTKTSKAGTTKTTGTDASPS